VSTGVVPASRSSLVILRAAAGPTVIVGVLATVLGAVFRGGPGALGAALGAIVVLVFFSVGQYVLGVILDNNPQTALSAALTLYLVKIGVLFALIAMLKDATVFDPKVFGLSVLACTIAWTCAEVWALGKTKMLVVEPGSGPGQESSGSDSP
jgi:ATP synthase protein I